MRGICGEDREVMRGEVRGDLSAELELRVRGEVRGDLSGELPGDLPGDLVDGTWRSNLDVDAGREVHGFFTGTLGRPGNCGGVVFLFSSVLMPRFGRSL